MVVSWTHHRNKIGPTDSETRAFIPPDGSFIVKSFICTQSLFIEQILTLRQYRLMPPLDERVRTVDNSNNTQRKSGFVKTEIEARAGKAVVNGLVRMLIHLLPFCDQVLFVSECVLARQGEALSGIVVALEFVQ